MGAIGQSALVICVLSPFQWIPVTKLGRLVKDMKIKSLEEIYLFSLPIKVTRGPLFPVGALGRCSLRESQWSAVAHA